MSPTTRAFAPLFCVAFLLPTWVKAAVYFVAPDGKDNQSGALAAPWATMTKAESMAQPGDTVYLRGGSYAFVSADAEAGVVLAKSGLKDRPIRYFAYGSGSSMEKPVFDFSGLTAQKRIKGVHVTGSYLHLRGIEMKGVVQHPALQAHENWCIYVQNGNGNVFERLNLHHNMGPGLFIVEGADNLVLNCDSHNNFDANSYDGGQPTPGENADGFGFHGRKATSTGNVFRGCRAWWNADDGYDFIMAATPVLVENCWAFNNGYKPGGSEPIGNGNGFKVGGFGMPPTVPAVLPQHTVRFSVAFLNRAAGFYQNHHPIANIYHNNTAYNNRGGNFNLLGYAMATADDKASMGVLHNNIAFTGTALTNATTGNGVDARNNTWNLTVTVTADDFVSLDTSGVSGPRRVDGSLPDLAFLKLKPGSDLIDKGVDIAQPFAGQAPDLGAFETGLVVQVRHGAAERASRDSRKFARGASHPMQEAMPHRNAAGRLSVSGATTSYSPKIFHSSRF
jgi:Right handed beta helix region